MSDLYSIINNYIDEAIVTKDPLEIYRSKLNEIGVPPDIQENLLREYQQKREDAIKPTEKDKIVQTIYDNEMAFRKEQLENINTLMGDLPKYLIGKEINQLSEDSSLSVSLRNLMYDIQKLPKMDIDMTDNESDTDEEDDITLDEYNNFRSILIQKCQAILYGENHLHEILEQIKTFEQLSQDIKDNGGTDINTYLKEYNEQLKIALKELQDLLEESLKKADGNPVKQQALKDIICHSMM
ncbi:hypothetical protein TBLA_0A08000 [Henningerozyma blattae CBS 6284]|uniref:Uncharacterized protein n=1 Tax=Henningerozyma blattae (strain ATCC 34711 / CBS 6284 / DSM 70876 / NBRC 10599 / NRRL Y-10934 / UCD 77-7) TaxID=1071380 RepID=I2GWT8_HENB6|nr:hypothetical protein TBLA_0A08000 [Tetrapisispora blattae CBS 6284]CCH58590.1 hypothetical protein TBLA_0A08000 [Tetrapisispora blattae CBS 6284]